MVSDGTYYSIEMVKKAAEKGIDLSVSALARSPSPENKLSSDQFEIDPDTVLIVACPGGAKSVTAERNRSKVYFKAKFD